MPVCSTPPNSYYLATSIFSSTYSFAFQAEGQLKEQMITSQGFLYLCPKFSYALFGSFFKDVESRYFNTGAHLQLCE